ncbi:MAG TPA: carboxypeptidase-like regulatory domain-containing protein [Chloroflexia bacterium]|nr:carboxypeptidase-like regulatory domain-containing protein [Chloroflexia bacterium]
MATPLIRSGPRSRLAHGLLIGGLLGLALSGLLLPRRAQAQPSPTRLWGYVTDYDGAFVAGATVTLYTLPAHVAAGPVATSDAQGAWSMDSGAGAFAARATAPGYDSAEQTIYATSIRTGVTFILRPLGAISAAPLVATMSGRVTSLDGAPLGGMNIVANGLADGGVQQVRPPPTLSAAATNADGMYTLRVPAGQVFLTVRAGAFGGYHRKAVQIAPGDNITGADFVVGVRVLDRTAAPPASPVPVVVPPAPPIGQAHPLLGGATPGMPSTGRGADGGLWLALVVLGLLAVVAGTWLARPAVL